MLLLLALIAGCDGRPAGTAVLPGTEPDEGELLVAQPPAGWVEVASLKTPALRMAEYGPAQEPEGGVERITFEAQAGAPLPDPIEFVLAVSRDLAARCRDFRDFNVSSGLENGYPTSVRLMICNALQDSQEGQILMAKAVRGNERFYVVTRRRIGPAAGADETPLSAQTMAEWTTYMKGISLCDTRRSETPCPDAPPAP